MAEDKLDTLLVTHRIDSYDTSSLDFTAVVIVVRVVRCYLDPYPLYSKDLHRTLIILNVNRKARTYS